MRQRVIIPFYWKGDLVGFTARSLDKANIPSYIMHVDHSFVFNIDNQRKDHKFVIVCEGPFDAMSVDGVAVLHNEVSKQQVDIINSLDREVIVVPDNDLSGMKMIDIALENNWSVSEPIWFELGCKDINEAVCKFGKLFCLKAIIAGKETNSLKIKLMQQRLKNNYKKEKNVK